MDGGGQNHTHSGDEEANRGLRTMNTGEGGQKHTLPTDEKPKRV